LEVKGINILSVDREIAEGQLRVYPNPSDSQIILSFPSGDGFVEIKIFDELGNVAMKDTVRTRKGNNYYSINTCSYHQGQYFVLIDYNGILQKDKFVIIR
jgi:hypothetical protein